MKLLSDLQGYGEFKLIIEEMISEGQYAIDVIRVLVLKQFGGWYMDVDVTVDNSPINLHYLITMYLGQEEYEFIGLGGGSIACQADHPVINTWL